MDPPLKNTIQHNLNKLVSLTSMKLLQFNYLLLGELQTILDKIVNSTKEVEFLSWKLNDFPHLVEWALLTRRNFWTKKIVRWCVKYAQSESNELRKISRFKNKRIFKKNETRWRERIRPKFCDKCKQKILTRSTLSNISEKIFKIDRQRQIDFDEKRQKFVCNGMFYKVIYVEYYFYFKAT